MTYYHVAPAPARRSISLHGIDPRRFSEAVPGFAGYEPHDARGCFLFDDLDAARWYADYMARMDPVEDMDIWEVITTGPLFPDLGLVVGVDEPEPGAWFHVGVADAVAVVEKVRACY